MHGGARAWYAPAILEGSKQMKTLGLLALAALTTAAFAQGPAPSKLTLKEGDMAPDFTISARMNTSGKEIKLSDYRGKKNVILAFFPAAFTGG